MNCIKESFFTTHTVIPGSDYIRATLLENKCNYSCTSLLHIVSMSFLHENKINYWWIKIPGCPWQVPQAAFWVLHGDLEEHSLPFPYHLNQELSFHQESERRMLNDCRIKLSSNNMFNPGHKTKPKQAKLVLYTFTNHLHRSPHYWLLQLIIKTPT